MWWNFPMAIEMAKEDIVMKKEFVFSLLFLLLLSSCKAGGDSSSSFRDSSSDPVLVDDTVSLYYSADSFSDFKNLYHDFKNHNTFPLLALDLSQDGRKWQFTYAFSGAGTSTPTPLSDLAFREGGIRFSFRARYQSSEDYDDFIGLSYELTDPVVFSEPFSKDKLSVTAYRYSHQGKILYNGASILSFRFGVGSSNTDEEWEQFRGGLSDRIVYFD